MVLGEECIALLCHILEENEQYGLIIYKYVYYPIKNVNIFYYLNKEIYFCKKKTITLQGRAKFPTGGDSPRGLVNSFLTQYNGGNVPPPTQNGCCKVMRR